MWNALRLNSLIILLAAHACAAELITPRAVERDGSFTVVYRTNPLATGKGTLTLKWTDVHGRLVEDRTVPVDLTDENEIAFTLDARRAAAIKNELTAHLSFEGTDKKGRPDRREEDARVTFIASPLDRAWRDYVILMWEPYNAEGFAKLKPVGINAGQYNGKSRTPPEFLLANDLRWYAENIATDFYSEYHRWFPDRPNHWRYLQAKELFLKDRTSKEAFKRNPSLSDPAWLARVRDRLVESARYHAPYNPVFYSLGDEAGHSFLRHP